MTVAPDQPASVFLRMRIGEAVAALAKGDLIGARWSAFFAGGELERVARENGGAVPWPPELEAEPLKGWAEWGVEVARRPLASAPAHHAAADGWRPKPGATQAAHTAGTD